MIDWIAVKKAADISSAAEMWNRPEHKFKKGNFLPDSGVWKEGRRKLWSSSPDPYWGNQAWNAARDKAIQSLSDHLRNGVSPVVQDAYDYHIDRPSYVRMSREGMLRRLNALQRAKRLDPNGGVPYSPQVKYPTPSYPPNEAQKNLMKYRENRGR